MGVQGYVSGLRSALTVLYGEQSSGRLMDGLVEAAVRHPFAVPPGWAGRLGGPGSPLWKQCVPDIRELEAGGESASCDPLAETRYAVLPGAIQRYQDRLLVFVSDRCAGYCRFCTRRRMVGRTGESRSRETSLSGMETVPQKAVAVPADRGAVVAWLRAHPGVRDVLLSGGDPLMLDDDGLEAWVREIREARPDILIRIGTRMPSFAPERVSQGLCRRLAAHGPVYVNVHFNHTDELTEEARLACRRMNAAGLITGNQTVLLAGVNDSVSQLRELFFGLLSCGVRPYYLHTMDHVGGTAHFRVPLSRAAALWEDLALTTSGMAVPRMMIDLPGGGGKIQYMRGMLAEDHGTGRLVFRNVDGGVTPYRDLPDGGPQ